MNYKVIRKEYDGSDLLGTFLVGEFGTRDKADDAMMRAISDFREHHDNDERIDYCTVDLTTDMGNTVRFVWNIEVDEEKEHDKQKLMEKFWGGVYDVADDLCETYEALYGVSSVYWKQEDGRGGIEDFCHTTLPRPENYVTEGFTDAFEKWGYDNVRHAIDTGCVTGEGIVWFVKGRCSPSKVYVCEYENYDDGRQVVAVFSTLPEAQEKMRIEYEGYRDSNPDNDIEWYNGTFGKWGWYDTMNPYGFYVDEIELDKWHK